LDVVAVVAKNTLANFVNNVSRTDIDERTLR
jgi:hypothetical protein